MLAYDSDDERSRSPGLQPIHFRYTPPASPISFGPRRRAMTDSEPREHQGRKRNRESRGGNNKHCQGNVVLVRCMEPNRPDIATEAGKPFYSSESASERGGDDGDEESFKMQRGSGKLTDVKLVQRSGSRPSPGPKESQRSGQSLGGPVKNDPDADMLDAPIEEAILRGPRVPGERTLLLNPVNESSRYLPRMAHGAKDPFLLQKDMPEEDSPFTVTKKKKTSPVVLPSVSEVSESIASSPQLRQHMLTAPQGSVPSRDTSMGRIESPRAQDRSIPSVKNLMKVAEAQDAEVRILQRPRTSSISSVNSAFAPNTQSHTVASSGSVTSTHFLPPKTSQAMQTTFSLGRVPTDPTPLPQPAPNIRPLTHASTNPADFAMHSNSNFQPTQALPPVSRTGGASTAGAAPASANDAPSSHATASERSATVPLPVSPDKSSHEDTTSPESTPQASVGPTLYKCSHPGCRAPPFQTPYLLNSHRNVHSSDRPYFCSRKDCPRSLPGKGFKRKNEMLRHGLVHSSPGYVCPYCIPDKEHRYPRPDNLQRHVRMHHEDADPDDPRLRDVLGQRKCTGGGGKNTNLHSTDGTGSMGVPSRSGNGGAKVEGEEPVHGSGGSGPQKARRRKGTA